MAEHSETASEFIISVTSLLYGSVLFLLVNNTRISILSARSLLLSRQAYVLIRRCLRYSYNYYCLFTVCCMQV